MCVGVTLVAGMAEGWEALGFLLLRVFLPCFFLGGRFGFFCFLFFGLFSFFGLPGRYPGFVLWHSIVTFLSFV